MYGLWTALDTGLQDPMSGIPGKANMPYFVTQAQAGLSPPQPVKAPELSRSPPLSTNAVPIKTSEMSSDLKVTPCFSLFLKIKTFPAEPMMNPFPDPFTTGPQFPVSRHRWQSCIVNLPSHMGKAVRARGPRTEVWFALLRFTEK